MKTVDQIDPENTAAKKKTILRSCPKKVATYFIAIHDRQLLYINNVGNLLHRCKRFENKSADKRTRRKRTVVKYLHLASLIFISKIAF